MFILATVAKYLLTGDYLTEVFSLSLCGLYRYTSIKGLEASIVIIWCYIYMKLKWTDLNSMWLKHNLTLTIICQSEGEDKQRVFFDKSNNQEVVLILWCQVFCPLVNLIQVVWFLQNAKQMRSLYVYFEENGFWTCSGAYGFPVFSHPLISEAACECVLRVRD